MATAAVQQALDAAREEIRQRAAWAIAGIESKRDDELAQLDPEAEETPSVELAPSAKPKRKGASRKGSKVNSPTAAKERQQRVFDYLAAQGGKVSPKQIREALGISESSLRKATMRLEEAGKVRREGERQSTTYEAITEAGEPASAVDAPVPTIAGRIIDLAQRPTGVSLDELVAELGLGESEAREEAGKLIAEEELTMGRVAGRSVYIAKGGS